MKILSAAQIREWDAFTITHEPIASIDLMERAATACCNWILLQNLKEKHFHVFCGKGNNGGDGLAIARMLICNRYRVTVYIIERGNLGSADFQVNLERLHQCSTDIHFIQSPEFFPNLSADAFIIDAIFGTGLNKPPEGLDAAIISHINESRATVIAIDLPSGMFADKSSKENTVIRATYCLSFQIHKLAFFMAENEDCCGIVQVLDIGLLPSFLENETTVLQTIEPARIAAIYQPRKKFAHKGTYGHALLIAGSHGMMGAAVLAANACLRSGTGKLTCLVPQCGYTIMQTSLPEAMCLVSGDDHIEKADSVEKFDAIGIGPGIGQYETHASLLAGIFKRSKQPLVIDADALNTIANNKALLTAIPPQSILTPHPGEFDRLFGAAANDFERLEMALTKSKELNIHIVLKGHYSLISTPAGMGYFNTTGNPGMATGGSGDVLCGIITGLLAQGYQPEQACLLGCWLHGLAGDIAAASLSEEAMIASDITDKLGMAFRQLASISHPDL